MEVQRYEQAKVMETGLTCHPCEEAEMKRPSEKAVHRERIKQMHRCLCVREKE